jgi:phage protein D
MANARRASLTLLYNNVSITADVSKDLLSFSYTDNDGDKADDLQVTLQDRNGYWAGPWFPQKGAVLTAAIVDAFTGQVLPCGTFEIDDVTVNLMPHTVTIKAASTPIESAPGALRREVKVRTWEGTTLQEIVEQLASESGVESYYDGPKVSYQRVDQFEESNLAFLRRKAKERGLSVKFTEGRLVVYSEKDAEATVPTRFIDADTSRVTSARLRTKSNDKYSKCRVRYHDAQNDADLEYVFEPEGAPATGQTLEVKERVESLADARELAAARLREKNRDEVTATITMAGDTTMQAGVTALLTSFGALDGPYLIERARHTYDGSSGYSTELTARKTLGY